jgi:hypothetical protein
MVTTLGDIIRLESKPSELIHASVWSYVLSVIQSNTVRCHNIMCELKEPFKVFEYQKYIWFHVI